MKAILIVVNIILMLNTLKADDIVMLTNKKLFSGKVELITRKYVKFCAENQKYWIPKKDIAGINFDINNKMLIKDNENDSIVGILGYEDAEYLHGRDFVYFLSGMAIFGVPLAFLRHPKPVDGRLTEEFSQNKEYFENPEYLRCYAKQARRNNISSALIGLVSWAVIIPIAYITLR